MSSRVHSGSTSSSATASSPARSHASPRARAAGMGSRCGSNGDTHVGVELLRRAAVPRSARPRSVAVGHLLEDTRAVDLCPGEIASALSLRCCAVNVDRPNWRPGSAPAGTGAHRGPCWLPVTSAYLRLRPPRSDNRTTVSGFRRMPTAGHFASARGQAKQQRISINAPHRAVGSQLAIGAPRKRGVQTLVTRKIQTRENTS